MDGRFPVVQQEAESSKLVDQEPPMQRDGLVMDSTVDRGKLSQAEIYQSRSLPVENELVALTRQQGIIRYLEILGGSSSLVGYNTPDSR